MSRKRVQRPMRAMGLRAFYRRPSTSRRSPEYPAYPLPAEECENHPAHSLFKRGDIFAGQQQNDGTPSQEAHRLCPSDDPATAPLAAQPAAGAGGGQWLRRSGSAPLPSIPAGTRHPYRQTAFGCRTLCTGATAKSGSKRLSPGERRPSAHLEGTPRPAGPLVDYRAGALVRWQHPHPRTLVPDRRLVPPRQAAGADALGVDSRPPARTVHQGLLCTGTSATPD